MTNSVVEALRNLVDLKKCEEAGAHENSWYAGQRKIAWENAKAALEIWDGSSVVRAADGGNSRTRGAGSIPTRSTSGDEADYKLKYEKLKEFVRGKWKGDCSECAAIANEFFNKENADDQQPDS